MVTPVIEKVFWELSNSSLNSLPGNWKPTSLVSAVSQAGSSVFQCHFLFMLPLDFNYGEGQTPFLWEPLRVIWQTLFAGPSFSSFCAAEVFLEHIFSLPVSCLPSRLWQRWWHHSTRQRDSQKFDIFIYLQRVGVVSFQLTYFIMNFPMKIKKVYQ